MPPRLALAEEIRHAATTKPGARGVRADVVAVVPAALALRVRARLDVDPGLRALDATHRRARRDQDEAQIVSEPRQGVVEGPGGFDIDLGGQRGADLLLLPLLFQPAHDHFPEPTHGVPALERRRLEAVIRDDVPGLLEDARVLPAREDPPRLLRGEAQRGRHQAQQAVGDVPQGGLRRTPGAGLRAAGIEPVLEDVEIESPQILRAEHLQLLHHEVELVAVVVGGDVVMQLSRERERVAVHLDHLGHGNGVARRIEIRGVREQEAQRVADAAVALDDPLQDLVRDRELAAVVGRRDPQAKHLGAERSRHLLRRNRIALRLRHLAAFAVDREAVGEQRLVGRNAVHHARHEKRRVEPAAVLVGALEVEVGGEGGLVLVRAAKDGEMGRARVEPDVERVLDLVVALGVVAQQLARVEPLPGLDPALLDPLGDRLHQLERVRVQLAAFLVDEERHRHAPLPLARQRPVRTAGDHPVQARLSPGGKEAGGLDASQRGRAQGLGRLDAAVSRGRVHAGEPLHGRAQDHRGLVPPAVHVAVHVGRLVEERPAPLELRHDLEVGVPDHHAAEQRQRFHEPAVALHGREDLLVLHAVAPAGLEVLDAVGRRRMHDPGAGIERDVVAEIDGRQAVVERVAERDAFERRSLAGGERGAAQLVAREAALLQVRGQDQQAALGVHEVIDEIGVRVERLVARNGPRRRGPDHGKAGLVRQLRQAERLGQPVGLREGEADVDRQVLAVLVFDLGLGERRAAVEAPVDRLQAAVDVALGEQRAERADLVGFVAVGHGQVGVVPVAEHAQALEVDLLALDLLGRVGAAQPLRLLGREVLAVHFLDLHLDRHAVAVPPRNVRRIEAGQHARLHDDVLEDLVHRMADMDVSVGVRRPVVEHEARPALGDLAQALVEAALLPLAHPDGLALGEVAAHRKRCIGEVQRLLVVSHAWQKTPLLAPHRGRSRPAARPDPGTSLRRAAAR